MKYFFKNSAGFTLLEMVVALGVFSLMIVAATGIFQFVIAGQRSALATQEVQESLRYALEYMSKEIRNAVKNPPSGCSGFPDQVYRTSNPFDYLKLRNKYDECITYTISGNRITRQVGSNAAVFLTPENVKVNNFLVNVVENSTNQPRVTLVIDADMIVSGKSAALMRVETTVSARSYE